MVRHQHLWSFLFQSDARFTVVKEHTFVLKFYSDSMDGCLTCFTCLIFSRQGPLNCLLHIYQVFTESVRLTDEAAIKEQTDEEGDIFNWITHQAKQGVLTAQVSKYEIRQRCLFIRNFFRHKSPYSTAMLRFVCSCT